MVDLMDYAGGGIGAIVGAGLTILGFRNRLNNIENNHHEFKAETQLMFKEIRDDIKTLIEKAGNRRGDDY
ncbi:hypothetical protein KA005_04825 [bacterium]|nr:hypothetical protein [bacterium]